VKRAERFDVAANHAALEVNGLVGSSCVPCGENSLITYHSGADIKRRLEVGFEPGSWALDFPRPQPVNLLNCADRNNCLRSVIWFLSQAPRAIAQHRCKILSIRALSILARPITKGNIQPCKPLCFQEKLETQPLFAFSRTAATTRTPQTKESRYPVFIRGNHGCYQNN